MKMNLTIYLLIICVIYHSKAGESTEESVTTSITENFESFDTTTTTDTITTSALTSTQNANETIEKQSEPLPTPLASKMQRSYIESPYTIIKHRTRYIKNRSKPRRRHKTPKPLYGPPNYIAGEPLTYYKSQLDNYDTSTLSFKPKIKYKETKKTKPSYFDLSSEINIQSVPLADFKNYLSANNFDFTKGGHYEKQPIPFDLYENLHGLSDGLYSNAGRGKFEEYYVDNKPPQTNYQQYPTSQLSYESFKSIEVPASVSYPPRTVLQSSYETPSQNYDGNFKNFGEPPVDVHYTYSTEYDFNPINPPSVNGNTYSGPKYLPPVSTDYSTSPDPNEYKNVNTNNNNNADTGYFAEPPNHPRYTQDSFAPIENSNLPLENNQKATTYEYPKSSYEVPLYNAPSLDTSTSQDEYYPPNIPHNYQPNIPDTFQPEQINALAKGTHKVEVTLFKNATRHHVKTHNQRPGEITQTISSSSNPTSNNFQNVSNQPIEYLESFPKTTTQKPRRKRKRTRTPPTQKIHNLDTDELRDAYGSETNQKPSKIFPDHFEPTPIDTSSNLKENKNINPLNANIENNSGFGSDFTSFFWEPVKVTGRSKNTTVLEPKIRNSVLTTISPRNHPPMPTKNVELISIQKSQSHSYYDGTISPEVFKELNRARKYPVINSKSDSQDYAVLSSDIMVSGNYQQNKNDNVGKSFNPKGSVIDSDLEGANSQYEYLTKELPQNHKPFK